MTTHRLQGRTAVITGGHVNLGLAIGIRFAKEGARVLVVGRNQEKVEAAQARVDKAGKGRGRGLVVDITTPEGPQQVLEGVQEAFGEPPNILVNSAGLYIYKAMLEVTPEDWDRVIAVQMTAPFRMTQALAQLLIDRDAAAGASVINIGSVHGPLGDPFAVHQCTAKAGLLGLTRGAAEALRHHGIRVNAILPGAIEPESADKLSSSLEQRITQGDVAEIAVYLASEGSRGITGACMEAYGVSRPVIGA